MIQIKIKFYNYIQNIVFYSTCVKYPFYRAIILNKLKELIDYKMYCYTI